MAELTPIPFNILATRLFHELEQKKAAFDLPAHLFFTGDAAHDRRFAGARGPEQYQNGAAPHRSAPIGGHDDSARKTLLDVDDQFIGHTAQTVFCSE